MILYIYNFIILPSASLYINENYNFVLIERGRVYERAEEKKICSKTVDSDYSDSWYDGDFCMYTIVVMEGYSQ